MSLVRIVRHLVVSARPRQWIKNAVVFAALVFAHELGNTQRVEQAALAFALFCAASSATYVANDLVDRARDRLHPTKRARPLATGELDPALALAFALTLAAGSLALAQTLLGRSFATVLAGFLALNLAYSLVLKRWIFVDVLAISLGFMLRALAGAIAIDVPASAWLVVLTLFLALFLALNKRKAELVTLGEHAPAHRPVLGEYAPALLDQLIAITTAGVIQVYALYTFNSVQPDHFVWSLPLVLYGIFRYLYLVARKGAGTTPEDALLGDAPLLACVALWVALMVAFTWNVPLAR